MNYSFIIKNLFRCKIRFTLPKKKEILIYDKEGSQIFFNFFKKEQCEIFHARFEEINLPILLLSILKLSKLSLSKSYTYEYIRYVEPKLIITFIDMRLSIYKLKQIFEKIKIIVIQNGIHSSVFKDFKNIKKSDNLFVDYFLVMDEIHKKCFSKFIGGNIHVIGSFKNNLISIKKKNQYIKNLLFISQFMKHEDMNTSEKDSWGLRLSFNEYFFAEKKLLPMLAEYCQKNNVKLEICGRTNSQEEMEEFKSLIEPFSNDWIFHPRKDSLTNYKRLDQATAIVHIDSTLGYEALGRKKPVATFSIRGENIDHVEKFGDFYANSNNFGLPKKFPDSGPFWSNHLNKSVLSKILDLVLAVNEDQWDKIYNEYATEIAAYDKGNSKFKKIIKSLNIFVAENN